MYNITKIGKIVALISFLIGTTLFSFFLYFGETTIPIMLGFKFIIVAFIINLILLMANLLIFLFDFRNRSEYLKTCGIILINIPVSILYFYIIISTEHIRI